MFLCGIFVGARTIILARLAEIYYNTSGIEKKLFPTGQISQIYEESWLESHLKTHAVDVGFFYEAEQVWVGKLRFISLPDHISMGNALLSAYYAKVQYSTAQYSTVQYSTVQYSIVRA